MLTPGVQRREDRYELTGLPVSVPVAGDTFRERLLAVGFASEGRLPGWRGLVRAAQPRWRARVLVRSAWLAAAQSGWHFGLCCWPWLALAGAGMLLGTWGLMAAWGAIAQAGFLFLMATIVHEAGHAVAFRALARPETPALLVGRGLDMHLVRPVLPPGRDLAVILAGPLAPAVAGLVAAPLLVQQPFAGLVWGLVAIVHVLALGVPIGDGANLRAWWHSRVSIRRVRVHAPGQPPSAGWSPQAASSDSSSEL